MRFGYRIEFERLVLLTRVLLIFVIKPSVIHVPFPNAFFVAF